MRGRLLSFIFTCHTAKGRRYSRDMQRLWQKAAYTTEICKGCEKPQIQPRYAKTAAEGRRYAKTAAQILRGRSVVSHWKQSFLNRRHQIISSQPIMIPEGMVTIIHIISLSKPPFLSQVLHLTTISTTQFTPGIRRRIICARRGSLLNQVIKFSFENICTIIISHYGTLSTPDLKIYFKNATAVYIFHHLRPISVVLQMPRGRNAKQHAYIRQTGHIRAICMRNLFIIIFSGNFTKLLHDAVNYYTSGCYNFI